MACAQNNSHIFSYNFTGSGLSAWFGNLSSTYAYLEYNSVMFSEKINIDKGHLKSPYIFIDSNCEVNFGDNFLIAGKVYLVDTKTFNDIYWLWTNSAMKEYIKEHDLKAVEYHNELYDTHRYELLALTGEDKTSEDYSI